MHIREKLQHISVDAGNSRRQISGEIFRLHGKLCPDKFRLQIILPRVDRTGAVNQRSAGRTAFRRIFFWSVTSEVIFSMETLYLISRFFVITPSPEQGTSQRTTSARFSSAGSNAVASLTPTVTRHGK